MNSTSVTTLLREKPGSGHHLMKLHATRVLEWPKVMRGGLAWDSSSLPSEEDIILTLTENDIVEVQAAVDFFNRELLFRTSPSGWYEVLMLTKA